jgi:hypothetical protein
VNQCFIESAQKGTLGFTLSFRVLASLDQPETPIKSFQRDTTLWITDKTVKRVLHELHNLGYPGVTLSGVDPDTPGFHDFRDLEINLICQHEHGGDEVYERWSLETARANLENKWQLRRFDRMLNPKPPRANGDAQGGITEGDVPF